MTTPGIPNEYTLSTTCFGTRLGNIQDQIFAAVGMGFRKIELGLAEMPPSMEGLEDSQRETGVVIPSIIAGCRDPLGGRAMAVDRLGSLVVEECERAMNSIRRHVRLAQSWNCNTVVVRGTPGYEQPEVEITAKVGARMDSDFGHVIRLDVGRSVIALAERPPLPIHPSFWKDLGVKPRSADAIVQKNFFHYRMFYAATAVRHLPVVSEGATSLRRLRERDYPVPMHPKDHVADWRDSDRTLRERSFRNQGKSTQVSQAASA